MNRPLSKRYRSGELQRRYGARILKCVRYILRALEFSAALHPRSYAPCRKPNCYEYILCLILLLLTSRANAEESIETLSFGRELRRSPFHPVMHRASVTPLATQTATVVGVDEELISELIQIKYLKAADIAAFINNKANSLLSERGKLNVYRQTNYLWVNDNKTHLQQIKQLIQQLDRPTQQVQIDARIVNISEEAIMDLGIRFGGSNSASGNGTLSGSNSLATQLVAPLAQRLNVDLAAPVLNPASMGIALAKLGTGTLLDLELSALESEDKAKIVAHPRLVATNQQAAIIESGEEIPYQEATLSGATAVAFKKAVLSLKVVPQITPDNRLLLDLEINQDTPSGRLVNGVPAITTKALHTHVIVNNGQTLVLGGIYKQDKNNSIKRVPFWGRLPVIGALFRNIHKKVKNEELLIFITPRIITNNLSRMTHQHEVIERELVN